MFDGLTKTLTNWVWFNKDFIYVIIFFAALLETVPVLGMFFPGQALIVIGGFFLATKNEFSWMIMLVASSSGAILGDYTGFMLGEWWGHRWLVRHQANLRVTLDVLRNNLRKYWLFSIIAGRFNNLTRSIVPVLAGSADMDRRLFLIANVTGGVLWSAASLGVGYAIGIGYVQATDIIGPVTEFVVGAVIAVWLLGALFKYWRDATKEAEQKARKARKRKEKRKIKK